MKTARHLITGLLLAAVVATLAIPAWGRVIDNSRPPGFDVAPGLDGVAEFTVNVIDAGASGNIILVDPIHICGSGRGG